MTLLWSNACNETLPEPELLNKDKVSKAFFHRQMCYDMLAVRDHLWQSDDCVSERSEL